jgi:hypothetical protein
MNIKPQNEVKMITAAILVGIWTTTCIQTQITKDSGFNPAGHVKETYAIEQDGSYEHKREWFRDSACTEPNGTDTESGTIELGDKIQGGLFFAGESYKADFHSQQGTDLGAISVKENRYLKIARGVKNSSIRNSMLSLFEHFKQK